MKPIYNSNLSKLSFCITCKNRIEQIKKTLLKNLEDNAEDEDAVEFVLVDFGSNDGLKEWIIENFQTYLARKYLIFLYTDEMPFWHASIAKNTSHYYANNEILVNLDCDNYTGYRGGRFLINKFRDFETSKIVIHQFYNFFDGTYGRISVLKCYFDLIGGYDESFEPMAYHDTDLILRLFSMGLTYVRLKDIEFNKAEKNDKSESIANTNSQLSWKEMHEKNKNKSRENIRNKLFYANNRIYGIRSHVYLYIPNIGLKRIAK